MSFWLNNYNLVVRSRPGNVADRATKTAKRLQAIVRQQFGEFRCYVIRIIGDILAYVKPQS